MRLKKAIMSGLSRIIQTASYYLVGLSSCSEDSPLTDEFRGNTQTHTNQQQILNIQLPAISVNIDLSEVLLAFVLNRLARNS